MAQVYSIRKFAAVLLLPMTSTIPIKITIEPSICSCVCVCKLETGYFSMRRHRLRTCTRSQCVRIDKFKIRIVRLNETRKKNLKLFTNWPDPTGWVHTSRMFWQRKFVHSFIQGELPFEREKSFFFLFLSRCTHIVMTLTFCGWFIQMIKLNLPLMVWRAEENPPTNTPHHMNVLMDFFRIWFCWNRCRLCCKIKLIGFVFLSFHACVLCYWLADLRLTFLRAVT